VMLAMLLRTASAMILSELSKSTYDNEVVGCLYLRGFNEVPVKAYVLIHKTATYDSVTWLPMHTSNVQLPKSAT
jgi:hypothetical protein